MNLDALQAGILLPAFAAGVLVLLTHVPLGAEVLRRGIVFLDLAIAQIAGVGIIITHALVGEAAGWQAQAGAVTAALAGASLLRWTERRTPERQEAIIGVAFAVAACVAVLLLSHDPHGGEQLRELLVGQILWTTWRDLLPLGAVSAGVLFAWHALRLKASSMGFYLLFAVTVTASVQVVGVYLVFASLIVPALAAGGRTGRGMAIGASGYGLGLLASALLDLPSGAAIVLALVGAALVASRMGREGAG
ncbi:MAG: metal ABC transporter permease [Betaproteobacteria bacterium]|nr:metal ABC transporter permease [Betaproteobacteria bacterium]